MQELKYRNEYKHVINKYDVEILKSKLKVLLRTDPFAAADGSYFIRSLYFDTYDDKALAEKLYGAPFRNKYRIRFYNHDPSVIKLENKIKRFNGTAKLNAKITKEEVEKIVNRDYEFLKDAGEPLKRDIYNELTSTGLVPKTIVDYTRYAFTYPHGNVRVTLDTDIRSPIGQMDIFNPNMPTISVFPNEKSVLEVKYDEYLPDFIHKIVQTQNRITSSMSKYAACRRFI